MVKKFGEAGVDGCFNWYANNWHYIRHWDHLKQWRTAAKLPLQFDNQCPDYQNITLPQSDDIMRRAISMQLTIPGPLSRREVDSIEAIGSHCAGRPSDGDRE